MTENHIIKNIKSSLNAVWLNVYWVRNYLAQYEVIAEYATELNKDKGHFWGITQKSALDLTVLNICKLFDTTNNRYPKDTIPSILQYFRSTMERNHISSLDLGLLKKLSIPESIIQRINDLQKIDESSRDTSFSIDVLTGVFDKFKNDLISSIEGIYLPAQSNPKLERLFNYRDKALAHQEREGSDQVLNKLSRKLPSLEEINDIAMWSENFCVFTNKIFSEDEELPSFIPYSAQETRDVIKKFLYETI